jgi:ABC transporter substrate binding protein
MKRRAFITLLGGAAAWPLAARAQQKSMPVIGFLGFGLPDPNPPNVNVTAFRQGLRELGYIEDRNILIEYRWAEGKPERFPVLAADLVALKVDVIVTDGGTLAALAAKRATTTLPIVFTVVGDPVAEGLVTSLARPGSNVTGLSNVATDLVGKWIELLKQVVPGVSLVALLLKPDSMPDNAKEVRLKEAAASARALGYSFKSLKREVRLTSTEPSRTCPRRTRVLWLCCQRPRLTLGDNASWSWRQRTGCRRCTPPGIMSIAAALCPTGRTLLICIGAPLPTWTRYSRAQSRLNCLSSSRPNSS